MRSHHLTWPNSGFVRSIPPQKCAWPACDPKENGVEVPEPPKRKFGERSPSSFSLHPNDTAPWRGNAGEALGLGDKLRNERKGHESVVTARRSERKLKKRVVCTSNGGWTEGHRRD